MESRQERTAYIKPLSSNSLSTEASTHHLTQKKQPYVSRQPDNHGHIHYSDDENAMWQALLERQAKQIPNRASSAYLEGLEKLKLPATHIPQLQDIDEVLQASTGWQTTAVPALISFGKFFKLLADKRFPVATFIRRFDDMEDIEEPDIFHEIVGHCPLLTHPAFADFTAHYGKLGVSASKQERAYLARLYWFTVEFGLLNSGQGLKIYGGGILSSPQETEYAYASTVPERREFNISDVLRTRYRIDVLQPIYYQLNSVNDLYDLANTDIMAEVAKARELGLFPLPESIAH